MKIIFLFIIIFIVFYLTLKYNNFSNIADEFEYLLQLYNKFNKRFELYNNNIKLNSVDQVYCISMPQR